MAATEIDPELPRIASLGDRALIVYWPTEADAQAFARRLRAGEYPWLEDAAPAYASVGVFFDIRRISLREARRSVGELMRQPFGDGPDTNSTAAKTHVIPCCYELALDMERVCERTGLTSDEVIRRHTSMAYTVHAIGFCPGFPYLGYLPEELRNVPRLDSPRLRLEPGSVGMTGRQTGIYPLARPGGWCIVGRTPLVIVDEEAGYFPIEVGDVVKFERIDERRFGELVGERL